MDEGRLQARRLQARRLQARRPWELRPGARRPRAVNGPGAVGRTRSRNTGTRSAASGWPRRPPRTASCSTGRAGAAASTSVRCSSARSPGCAVGPGRADRVVRVPSAADPGFLVRVSVSPPRAPGGPQDRVRAAELGNGRGTGQRPQRQLKAQRQQAPSTAFMIMARKGQIPPRTGHDHDRRPKCLDVKLRHNGYNGFAACGCRSVAASGGGCRVSWSSRGCTGDARAAGPGAGRLSAAGS